MLDPPLRSSPPQPPPGETTIYVVGGDDLLHVEDVLREHGYIAISVEPSALAERIRKEAPAAVIVDAATQAARTAVLGIRDLVAGTATDVFLIVDSLKEDDREEDDREEDDRDWSDEEDDRDEDDRDWSDEEDDRDEDDRDDEEDDRDEDDRDEDDEGERDRKPWSGDARSRDEAAIRAVADEVFTRPIDVDRLLDRIHALAQHRGGVTAAPPPPASSPLFQSDQPGTVGLFDAEEAERLLGDGLPPAPLLSYPPSGQTSTPPSSSSAPPGSGWPSSVPAPMGVGALNNGSFAGPTSVSAELEKLLAEAERRVLSEEHASFEVPSPEAEVNAILPPEVLAALDDPLEVSDDEDLSNGSESQTPVGRGTSGGTTGGTVQRTRGAGTDSGESVVPAEPVTAHGDGDQPVTAAADVVTPVAESAPASPAFGRRPSASTMRNPQGSSGGAVFSVPMSWQREAPPTQALNGDATPIPSDVDYPPRPQVVERMEMGPRSYPSTDSRLSPDSAPMSAVPRTTAAGSQHFFVSPPSQVRTPELSPAVDAGPGLPEVLTPEYDGLRALGLCIASRVSATLCFEYNGVLCRAVMRDGDFVTCGSSADDESLLAFLMLRGDMPREVGMQMVGRIPPYGRHAAAALIANGFVGQDQLWVVLRAHAEWLLGRMASTQGGTCALEAEPQGRLRAEPAVFGGATGAEVFVEVCQRVLPYEDAIERLGGPGTRLGPGVNEALITECALTERERAAIERSPGRTLEEVLDSVGQPEFGAVLVALHELGVIDIMASIGGAGVARQNSAAPDPLDEEAIRKRVKARVDIIQEGDYFEVIGVPRSATGYEIRRAYLESRRAFEPAHLLTAQTADLVDNARLIIEVLDEAYELLRDEPRRERYRRALEAVPPPDR